NVALGAVLYSDYGEYQTQLAKHLAKNKEIANLTLHAITERGPKEENLKELKRKFEEKKEKLPESANIGRLIDDLAPITEKNKCRQKSADIDNPTEEGNVP